MSTITIYGNESCAFCGAARMLLTKKGIKFEDILVSNDAEKRAEMEARSQQRSVPQIFIGDKHVGGFEELCDLDKSGELDKLLADS
ncbi:MAG: glutaredoxin 3 [Gammaproteobacteria bacterium]|nr:glutaredoxin 3 [Gammaproteobacteria bacterium]